MSRSPKREIPSKKKIGERVRALRLKKGFSQFELAEQLGTTQSNLSEMERGIRGITLQQLMKASRVLVITTDEILFGSPKTNADADELSLKILRRVRRIKSLPPAKQRAVLEILDAVVEKKTRDNGASR